MEGIASVRVKDVELRRTFGSNASRGSTVMSGLSPSVQQLLNGFVFWSS